MGVRKDLISRDNLPTGRWWEVDGSCWRAVACEPHPTTGKDWRWEPCNFTAFGKGEPSGEMYPHYPLSPAILSSEPQEPTTP